MYLSTLTPESEVRGMRFPFKGLVEGLFCIFFSKLDSHQNKAGIAKSRPQVLIILWYLPWLYNQPANRGCYWLLAFEISGNEMKIMVYSIIICFGFRILFRRFSCLGFLSFLRWNFTGTIQRTHEDIHICCLWSLLLSFCYLSLLCIHLFHSFRDISLVAATEVWPLWPCRVSWCQRWSTHHANNAFWGLFSSTW